jgi:hypothetical protein
VEFRKLWRKSYALSETLIAAKAVTRTASRDRRSRVDVALTAELPLPMIADRLLTRRPQTTVNE